MSSALPDVERFHEVSRAAGPTGHLQKTRGGVQLWLTRNHRVQICAMHDNCSSPLPV
jgi:hypothetical protein